MAPTEAQRATELAEWRGRVDEWKRASTVREEKLDKALDRIETKQDEQGDLLLETRVRRTIFTAGISLVGGGVVTFAVLLGTKAIG